MLLGNELIRFTQSSDGRSYMTLKELLAYVQSRL